MTDQKAIAIFTGLKMMVGTEAKEACDIAISALQERDERSKPIMEWQKYSNDEWIYRRLDYLKTELEFAEKCKECKKKREPLELKWIPIAEELPEKNSNVLVYVQNTRGGFIRGDGYITVATFVPTMIDKYYFNFHGEGLVTHWMGLPKKPEDLYYTGV